MIVATAVFPGTRAGPCGPPEPTTPHWSTVSATNPAVAGDVVWAVTSGRGGVHDFTIARFVEPLPHSGALVRELGGVRTCRITNEMFYVLRGIRPESLFEGKEWRAYEQIRRCFALFDRTKGWNRYDCLLSRVRFEASPPSGLFALVVVRPHAFVASRGDTFEVRIDVSGRLPSQRSIAERIWDACPWHEVQP